MKTVFIALVFSLGMSLITFPCLAAAAMKTLTKADDGTETRVRVGDMIELSLEEQGGTGYTWKFDHLDTNHLELMKSGTKPLGEETRMGGPVLKTWQLKAIKEGETKLRLDYFRPWEGKAKAERHYLVKIHVQ